MDKLIIKGKKSLSGSINISGSKNASLPILAASILSEKKIILKKLLSLSEPIKSFLGTNLLASPKHLLNFLKVKFL